MATLSHYTDRHLGDDPEISPNHVIHYPRPQQQQPPVLVLSASGAL